MAREGGLQDFNKVWECKGLQNFPQAAIAKAMLDRLALQVEPIMKARKWRVVVLREFFPTNPGLQGMNVNRQTIHIRLRPQSDRSAFLPWPHLLGTMLHELCHMVHGPHHADFYALLDELWAEVERLPEVPGPGGSAIMVVDQMGQQVTGAAAQAAVAASLLRGQGAAPAAVPFVGEGHKLGAAGKIARPLSVAERRNAAAAAAEQRLQRSAVMGRSGGQRLGSAAEGAGAGGQPALGGSAGYKRPASAQLPTSRADKANMIAAATERRLAQAQARVDSMACGNAGHAHGARGQAQGACAGSAAGGSGSGSAAHAPCNTAAVDVIELDEEGREVLSQVEGPSPPDGHEQEQEEEEHEVVLVDDDDEDEGHAGGSSSIARCLPSSYAGRGSGSARPPPAYTCGVCTFEGMAGSAALACEVCGNPLGDNSRVPPSLVWSR